MTTTLHNAPAPEAGKHSFDGSCAPGSFGTWGHQIGFSVGVFQWVPKADGKGLKRSAVKVRIKGFVCNADKVYAKALEISRKLDAGESIKQKSITV